MPRRFSPEQLAAISFALARTALCGYRAAQQSFTVDESTTFLSYVRGPWARVYSHYDPNNHVLYSMLAKLSVRAFRVSEFTLRLPSVLAGFFLILALYWVLEITTSSRAIRWVALIVLSLNPLLLDLSVAARGYGLGLALLVWAVYFSVRGSDFLAGVLLGFSVSANLTMAFPAAGVIACPLLLGEGNLEIRTRRILTLAIPAAAIAAVISYPAFRGAQTSQFYVGEPTLGASIFNLIFTFVRASVNRLGLFGTGRGAHSIEFVFLPAVLLFILAVSVRTFLRDHGARPSLVPAVALLASLAELAVAHYLAGMNYPVDRVGLYLFLLLGLAWAAAASQIPNLALRAIQGVLACLLAVQFLTQFETRYFELWAFDLPAKDVARRIRDESRGNAPQSIALSATWFQQPALEFYRDYYHIAALKPVERHTQTLLAGFDYYVLNLKDDGDVKTGNWKRLSPLYSEPLSGVLLAKEPPKEQAP